MEPLIIFDSKKCISCHACEVACQLENDAPPGLQLRQVKTHVDGKFPDCSPQSISTACFHCSDPSCVAACPAGALQRRSNGVVEHIRTRCIGCGYCIQSCPFNVPQFSPAQHTMRKCGFCAQRIDLDQEPACVSKCTTGALTYRAEWENGSDTTYGRAEHLHMIYKLEDRPGDYSLPEPVPLNSVTSNQAWKWLIGFLPGGLLLSWLWKNAENQEKDHE
jgi:formate dehydrogenase iron-sulfur subunit